MHALCMNSIHVLWVSFIEYPVRVFGLLSFWSRVVYYPTRRTHLLHGQVTRCPRNMT